MPLRRRERPCGSETLLRSTRAILPLALITCTPDTSGHYETEHLVIDTVFADPLCGGDLALWEGLVVALEEHLDVEIE